jgi:hypothetical protein
VIEPIDEVLHTSGCFKGSGGLKDDAQALTVGGKSLDMVWHRLVFAAMILTLGTVLERYAVSIASAYPATSSSSRLEKRFAMQF